MPPSTEGRRMMKRVTGTDATSRSSTMMPAAVRPAIIARCRGTADVRAALEFARARGLPVSIRGGGHNGAGHAVCDEPEWINGLSNPIRESYHPNRAGHSSGYTPLVSPLLTGAS